MQNNNLDTQINNFLSKPLKNDDHFTSAKLAILDTLGCIIEASSHDEVNNFAIEDKSSGIGLIQDFNYRVVRIDN